MQITRKQLKQIISEETERLADEADKYDTLLESYAAGYNGDEERISKEALIDMLEVLEESTIPREAFDAFMQNMPENLVEGILSEVVDLEQDKEE